VRSRASKRSMILQKPRGSGFSKSLLPRCPTAYGTLLKRATVFLRPFLDSVTDVLRTFFDEVASLAYAFSEPRAVSFATLSGALGAISHDIAGRFGGLLRCTAGVLSSPYLRPSRRPSLRGLFPWPLSS